MSIEVPRDKKPKDDQVTKDIENYILSIFSENEEYPYTNKELVSMVKRKFSSKYGNDLESHTAWARDMLFFNKLIKRVGPGIYQADSGPDEVYTERETGHAPEGEFANRGYNTKDTTRPKKQNRL